MTLEPADVTRRPSSSVFRHAMRELTLIAYVALAVLLSTPLGVMAHLSEGHAVDAHGHMVHVDSSDSHEHAHDVPCDDERGQSDQHCQTHLGTLSQGVTPVVVAPLDVAASDHVADAGRALDAHRVAEVWRLAPKTSPPQV